MVPIGAWAVAGLLGMSASRGEVANLVVVGEHGFPFGKGILFFISDRLEPMHFEVGVVFAIFNAFVGESRELPFRISSKRGVGVGQVGAKELLLNELKFFSNALVPVVALLVMKLPPPRIVMLTSVEDALMALMLKTFGVGLLW